MTGGDNTVELRHRDGSLRNELARWFVAPDFYREREVTVADWVEGVFEPTAIVATIVCFVIGLVHLGLTFAPDWSPTLLIPLTIVVSLEAFFYARRLARPSFILKEWTALLIPPLLILRFAPYVVSPQRLSAEFPLWWSEPQSFFTLEFLVGALFLLIAWWASYQTTYNLNQIRVQPGEVPSAGQSANRYGLDAENVRLIDHTTPLRSIASRFLWGGMVLVFVGGLAALSVEQAFTLEAFTQLVTFARPSQQLVLANVVLYFVFGFLLLGEAQYVRLNTLWRLDRLSPPSGLAGRWAGYLVTLAAVVLVVALLLPTEYALTLATVLNTLLAAVAQLLTLLAMIIFVVLSIILWPLRFLSSGGGEDSETPPLQPPVFEPPPTSEPIPWMEFLKSALFWLVLLGIVVYFLGVLYRERRPLPSWLPARSFLARTLGLIGALWRAIARIGRRAAVVLSTAIPRIFARPVAQVASAPRRWLSLRSLGPRDKIAYFYLSVVERATRLGYARLPGQTASEYSRMLRERLPEINPELDELTVAFLEARYGPRPVTPQALGGARQRWQALKLKLRRIREKVPRRGG